MSRSVNDKHTSTPFYNAAHLNTTPSLRRIAVGSRLCLRCLSLPTQPVTISFLIFRSTDVFRSLIRNCNLFACVSPGAVEGGGGGDVVSTTIHSHIHSCVYTFIVSMSVLMGCIQPLHGTTVSRPETSRDPRVLCVQRDTHQTIE